jgi:hypothetical protein
MKQKLNRLQLLFLILFKLPDDANGDYAPRLNRILTSPTIAVDS